MLHGKSYRPAARTAWSTHGCNLLLETAEAANELKTERICSGKSASTATVPGATGRDPVAII
jgi:hypothetical protein